MDELIYPLLYLLLGAVAGTLAGLLGVGGGLVIVPALAAIYVAQGMASDIIMHLALGTSLATIIITSISSIRAHHQRGAVLWPVFRQLTPGILLGAWLGGWLAGQMSTGVLKPVFAVFAMLVAIQMLTGRQVAMHRNLPGPVAMGGAGGIIGIVSSVVGIGGGSMTVPFLAWNGVHLRQAIATSAACGLPIAIAGTLSYVASGWRHTALPSSTLGFVHGPAFIGIIISSMLFAPLGAKLAHSLPVNTVKRVFALLLMVVAARLLLSEF